MGRGSSRKRDTKKDDLTEAQINRRERKKAKRQAILSKKGIKPTENTKNTEEATNNDQTQTAVADEIEKKSSTNIEEESPNTPSIETTETQVESEENKEENKPKE